MLDTGREPGASVHWQRGFGAQGTDGNMPWEPGWALLVQAPPRRLQDQGLQATLAGQHAEGWCNQEHWCHLPKVLVYGYFHFYLCFPLCALVLSLGSRAIAREKRKERSHASENMPAGCTGFKTGQSGERVAGGQTCHAGKVAGATQALIVGCQSIQGWTLLQLG